MKNTCIKADGTSYDRKGVAHIKDKNEPAKLELVFNDGLPSDGPSPYWVHWTDYKNYSIVGGPSGKFLWILGREPKITKADLKKLLNLCRSIGYNISDVSIANHAL